MFITLNDVRTYQKTKTSDTSNDALINSLIPSVVAELAELTGKLHPNVRVAASTISFSGTSIGVSGVDFTAYRFAANMVLKVQDSLANDGFYLAQSVATNNITVKLPGETTFVTESAGETITISLVIIPLELKTTALAMITYKMNLDNAHGITAKSYGRFSESYTSNYPDSIKSAINRFKKVKW